MNDLKVKVSPEGYARADVLLSRIGTYLGWFSMFGDNYQQQERFAELLSDFQAAREYLGMERVDVRDMQARAREVNAIAARGRFEALEVFKKKEEAA